MTVNTPGLASTRRLGYIAVMFAVTCLMLHGASAQENHHADARLQKAYRFQQNGWIYVHLEGSPFDIGFQHGYLLAPEIQDAFQALRLQDTHRTKRDWEFFRKTAHEMLWPHIDGEYRQELEGIVEGLKAQRVQLDIDDVVALNAFQELADYYVSLAE